MRPESPTDLLHAFPYSIYIQREIARSNASSILQIELDPTSYAMEVVSIHGVC